MKKYIAQLITLAVVLLALVLGWFAWEHYTRSPWTRDARVRADVVTLSADVSGLIASLRVQDNQHVSKGELLLEIDPARYALAVEHARRSVEVAQATMGQSEAAIIASQAQLKQRQSEERRRRSLKQGSPSPARSGRSPIPTWLSLRRSCSVTRPTSGWPKPMCSWQRLP